MAEYAAIAPGLHRPTCASQVLDAGEPHLVELPRCCRQLVVEEVPPPRPPHQSVADELSLDDRRLEVAAQVLILERVVRWQVPLVDVELVLEACFALRPPGPAHTANKITAGMYIPTQLTL